MDEKEAEKKRSLRNEKLKANRTSETEEQRKERLRIRREKDRARRRTKGKKGRRTNNHVVCYSDTSYKSHNNHYIALPSVRIFFSIVSPYSDEKSKCNLIWAYFLKDSYFNNPLCVVVVFIGNKLTNPHSGTGSNTSQAIKSMTLKFESLENLINFCQANMYISNF